LILSKIGAVISKLAGLSRKSTSLGQTEKNPWGKKIYSVAVPKKSKSKKGSTNAVEKNKLMRSFHFLRKKISKIGNYILEIYDDCVYYRFALR